MPSVTLRPPSGVRLVVAVLALSRGCASHEPPPVPESQAEPAAASSAARADEEPVRIKGLAPHLRLHRQRDGRIEELHDGAVARPGDLVQLSYVAAGNHNGVVISVDGRGTVTLHHPARTDAAPTLVARGQHALDHAYELDDARSFERFVFVTSGDEPLSPQQVVEAARRLARAGPTARHSPLPLPDRWQQSSIILQKSP